MEVLMPIAIPIPIRKQIFSLLATAG